MNKTGNNYFYQRLVKTACGVLWLDMNAYAKSFRSAAWLPWLFLTALLFFSRFISTFSLWLLETKAYFSNGAPSNHVCWDRQMIGCRRMFIDCAQKKTSFVQHKQKSNRIVFSRIVQFPINSNIFKKKNRNELRKAIKAKK